jgi:hypothetical protein
MLEGYSSILHVGYGYREKEIIIYGNTIRFRHGDTNVASIINDTLTVAGAASVGSLTINGATAGTADISLTFKHGTLLDEYYDHKIGKFTDANSIGGFGIAMAKADGTWYKYLGTTTDGYYGVISVDVLTNLKVSSSLTVSEDITASGFKTTAGTDESVLLAGGGTKKLSDFALNNNELTNNLTTITKTLTVTKDWMDTGIDGDDFETGTYAVQLSCNHNSDDSGFWDCYWSGIMSWWKGRTNDTDTDEIVLHRAGRYYDHTLYLRTVMRSNTDGNGLKLQIAASSNIGVSCTYTFKFKKLI